MPRKNASLISQKRILHVLGSLYESARECSNEAWSDTFTQMADMFSSGPGSLSLISAEDDSVDSIATTYSRECLGLLDTRFRDINPIYKKVVQTPVGKTFWRVRDCPDQEFINTEFYQDLLRKENVYDIRYFKLCDHSGLAGGVSFSRPRSKPTFSSDELEAMEFLVPHLQRALQIHLTLSDFRAQGELMNEVMSKSPRGILLLNRSAKVVFCNEAAEKIIAAKDGLEIDRNRCLVARRSQDTQQLKMVLNGVFDPDPDRAACHGGFLQVSRPTGSRPFQIHVSPLSHQNFGGYSPEKLALLFVFDPEQRFGTVEELLRRMYGLTPAEARLAGILAKGISLKEAEALLNVKSSTIHTHMKHIFSKTECKRQGELITVIFNGLAGLKNI